MKKCEKRGFTVAELCIVLAVISIVSTVVISFTAMVTQRSKISRAQLSALQDIELIETLVEAHIESVSNTSDNQVTVFWNIDDKKLTVGNNTYTFESVEEISFSTLTENTKKTENTETATDILYICKVTYQIPYEKNTTHTYTFCVNPYVGETVN